MASCSSWASTTTSAVGGNLTLQSVKLIDPATALSSEPENLPEQAGRGFVRFPVAAGVQATLEAEYTGTQFCQDPDTGQDVELDDGTWFNAGLSKLWRLGRGGFGQNLQTSVRAQNLGNTTLYDQCGLPRPGRILRFQVRVF